MAIPFPLRSQITTHTRVLNLLRNNYCESEFWILILDRGLSENKNQFSSGIHHADRHEFKNTCQNSCYVLWVQDSATVIVEILQSKKSTKHK